jgi:BASS family bile acid:Na+ symporter
MNVIKFVKDWTLPLSMLFGTFAYFFLHTVPIPVELKEFLKAVIDLMMPLLIFVMLFVTFCKVYPRELKLVPWHLWLTLIQVVGCVAVYYALAPFNKIVAEAAMVCVICPTATAAAVITGKLGGSASSLTTYTLLSNLFATVVVPLIFPIVEPHASGDFFTAFLMILKKIFPLLICPFLAACLLQVTLPKVNAKITSCRDLAFYLWAVSLSIVTGKTVKSLVESQADPGVEIWIALAALAVCCLQFILGKSIGGAYNDRISAGQALGQKNTVLAIWMAYTFLNPLSSVGPGSYVLWQNIINSWQLWKKRKKEAAGA